jgi:hypothetical protein
VARLVISAGTGVGPSYANGAERSARSLKFGTYSQTVFVGSRQKQREWVGVLELLDKLD